MISYVGYTLHDTSEFEFRYNITVAWRMRHIFAFSQDGTQAEQPTKTLTSIDLRSRTTGHAL